VQRDPGGQPHAHYEFFDLESGEERLSEKLMGVNVPLAFVWPDRMRTLELMRFVSGLRSLPPDCPFSCAYAAISKTGEVYFEELWRTLDRAPM
jgi:hypothetical protein